jgi:hypothetical protein
MIIDVLVPGHQRVRSGPALQETICPNARSFFSLFIKIPPSQKKPGSSEPWGYVLKLSAHRELLQAIRDAQQGSFFLSSELKADYLQTPMPVAARYERFGEVESEREA